MTVTIELSSEEAAFLERNAQEQGVAPEERVRSFVIGGLAQEMTKGRYSGLRDLFRQWQNEAEMVEKEQKIRDETNWAAAQTAARQNPVEI